MPWRLRICSKPKGSWCGIGETRSEGNTALVTGSSRRLGAGIATALAEADVNLTNYGSRRRPVVTQQILSNMGVNQLAVFGDVSDASVCSLLIELVVDHFGALDILFKSPGIIGTRPPRSTLRTTGGLSVDGHVLAVDGGCLSQ
jgi:NAD(P)-dependent dehydrogenase (short-subunit alcohol dehydrogenase family)